LKVLLAIYQLPFRLQETSEIMAQRSYENAQTKEVTTENVS